MNGELVAWEDAKVHVLTHALHYGTGVFEGIRAYDTPRGTAIFRHADHIDRLFHSAGMYLMDIPFTREEIRAGDARDDRPQRPAVLLRAPARLPRRRPDGPLPARQPRRGGDRRLGVGRLPRRRGQAARRARQGLVVPPDLLRRRDPRGQGDRPVRQLGAGQDRGRQGGLRGGDPARRPRARLRGLRREPVRGQGRRDRHPRLRRRHPRRDQPRVGDHNRARPRLRGRRARRRPRRALPGRRDLHDRHRRRADAAARGRRPAGRERRAGRDHPHAVGRLPRRAPRPLGPLRRVAGRVESPAPAT